MHPVARTLWRRCHPVVSYTCPLHRADDVPGGDPCPKQGGKWGQPNLPAQILLRVLNRNFSADRRPWDSCYGELSALRHGLIFKISAEKNHLGLWLCVLQSAGVHQQGNGCCYKLLQSLPNCFLSQVMGTAVFGLHHCCLLFLPSLLFPAAGARLQSQRTPGWLDAFSPHPGSQQQTWLLRRDLQPAGGFFLLQGNVTKGHLLPVADAGQEKSKLRLGKVMVEKPCKILTPGGGHARISIFHQRSILTAVKAASPL